MYARHPRWRNGVTIAIVAPWRSQLWLRLPSGCRERQHRFPENKEKHRDTKQLINELNLPASTSFNKKQFFLIHSFNQVTQYNYNFYNDKETNGTWNECDLKRMKFERTTSRLLGDCSPHYFITKIQKCQKKIQMTLILELNLILNKSLQIELN